MRASDRAEAVYGGGADVRSEKFNHHKPGALGDPIICPASLHYLDFLHSSFDRTGTSNGSRGSHGYSACGFGVKKSHRDSAGVGMS